MMTRLNSLLCAVLVALCTARLAAATIEAAQESALVSLYSATVRLLPACFLCGCCRRSADERAFPWLLFGLCAASNGRVLSEPRAYVLLGYFSRGVFPVAPPDDCARPTALPPRRCALSLQAGASWTDNGGSASSWEDGAAGDACVGEWSHVVCDGGNVNVVSLTLGDNNLVGGGLPADFTDLTALTALTLSGNVGLTGTVPALLFGMPSLVNVLLDGTGYV